MEAVMDRREWFLSSGKKALVTAAIGSGISGVALLEEGCTSAQWLTTLENDLPTLIQIAANIAGIITTALGGGLLSAAVGAEISAIGTDISAGLTALQAIINTYNAASASTKTTLLGKVIAGVQSIVSNIQALLAAAHINNPGLAATITGSATVFLTILLAIQSLLPAAPPPVPASAEFPRARVALGQSQNVRVANPKNANLHDVLVAVYNEIVMQNGYGKFVVS
jgi:hypothetical protein